MTALKAMEQHHGTQDSGIEWLGDIPAHWQLKRLKFVVDIVKRIAGKEGFDVLSITQKGIKVKDVESGEGQLAMDYSKYQFLYKGEFAMNHMDLLTGYVDISQYDGVVSPDYRVFRNRSSEVLDAYLLLIFQMGYRQRIFYKYGQGVSFMGRWRFPADNFNNFFIPIPSLEEQKLIVDFVLRKSKQIDEAIEIKRKEIALLMERKQVAVLKAVTQGLDPTAQMKDSGLDWIGRIPKHWELKKIKHVTSKIGSGVTPTGGGAAYLDQGVPLLRSQNVHFDRIDLTDVARISEKTHRGMSNSKVRKGDVLLNITGGSIGRCFYVSEEGEMNVNQHVCIVRPNSEIQTVYLNAVLASEIGQAQIWFFQQGGGREGLNFQALKNFSIPLPPESEQEKIAAHVNQVTTSIYSSIEMQRRQIEKLKEYKATLMHSAVAGKIRVA